MEVKARSERTRVRRIPKRGAYDDATIAAILDAGLVCHVGFVDGATPLVIPMLYWREGDRIYLHGSRDSRILRVLCESEVCVTVTHLDGIVLARSAFHHSANYRSVTILGRPQPVAGAGEKTRAMHAFVDRLAPDRWGALRPVTPKELDLTSVVVLSLNEASAKIRTGGPVDDPGDLTWPCWAGVVPVELALGEPVAEANVTGDAPQLSLG